MADRCKGNSSDDPFACPSNIGDDQITCPCDSFITMNEQGNTKSIGDCDFTFPDTVPVKSLLNGTIQSPWVKIAFQLYCPDDTDCGAPCNTGETIRDDKKTNETVITTGNISQPGNDEKCHAAIKSFQYGWGAVDAGNRCKITIVDEKGGSFEQWVPRLIKNIEGATKAVEGIYQMKVQFGWFITGSDDDDLCGQPFVPPGTDATKGQTNTSNVVCSQVLWFIPDMINVNYQGNKFIYELEGVDTLVRGQEHVIAKAYGRDQEPRYFTDAVQDLAASSFPPFRVEFLQNNPETGAFEAMRFRPRKGCEATDDVCKGPFQKWVAYERSPLAVIHHWLKQGVMAEGGKINKNNEEVGQGITMNYDSTFDCQKGDTVFKRFEAEAISDEPGAAILPCGITPEPCVCDPEGNIPDVGRLCLWANGLPACQGDFTEDESNSRMGAVYVVNGGNCSPVYAFNPSIKWHFFTSLRAGGLALPSNGKNAKQIEGQVNSACVVHGGRGNTTSEVVPSTDMINAGCTDPRKEVQTALVKHTQANLFAHSVEAELRVQGDPSDLYISPVFGYGRTVGIVFINPYFLQVDKDNPDKACPIWNNLINPQLNKDGTVKMDNDGNVLVTESVCNSILTNKGWFIKGVDHQIKEGSFITTIKVILPMPGGELDDATDVGTFTGFGGWVKGFQAKLGGLWTCLEATPLGNFATKWFNQKKCDILGIFQAAGTDCDAQAGQPIV